MLTVTTMGGGYKEEAWMAFSHHSVAHSYTMSCQIIWKDEDLSRIGKCYTIRKKTHFHIMYCQVKKTHLDKTVKIMMNRSALLISQLGNCSIITAAFNIQVKQMDSQVQWHIKVYIQITE